MKRVWFRDSDWLNRSIHASEAVLDVGAGGRRRAAHVTTMDILPIGETDVIHDANKLPWPFDSNTFDYVIMSNVLEHIAFIPQTMAELQRIGKHGSTIRIICPHFSNPCSYVDVTHQHALSVLSMDTFCVAEPACAQEKWLLLKKILGCDMGVGAEFREARFLMQRRSLRFREALWWTLAPLWANLFQEFYEVYMRNLIPAWDVVWELQVVK